MPCSLFDSPIKGAPLSHFLLKKKIKHSLVPTHCPAYSSGSVRFVESTSASLWAGGLQVSLWAGRALDWDQAELGSNPTSGVSGQVTLSSGSQNPPLAKVTTCPLLGQPQGSTDSGCKRPPHAGYRVGAQKKFRPSVVPLPGLRTRGGLELSLSFPPAPQVQRRQARSLAVHHFNSQGNAGDK